MHVAFYRERETTARDACCPTKSPKSFSIEKSRTKRTRLTTTTTVCVIALLCGSTVTAPAFGVRVCVCVHR